MPGLMKRVRFSRTNTAHEPETSPPMTSSTYSPPSSVGLITPPDAYIGLPGPTPYHLQMYDAPSSSSYAANIYTIPPPAPNSYKPYQPFTYNSPTPSIPISIPVLTRRQTAPPASYPPQKLRLHTYLESSSSSKHGAISYDLLDPPSSASRHHHALSSSALAESATNPASASLYITTTLLPQWDITIHPTMNGVWVTLGDVLDGVYDSLRRRTGQRDYESLSGGSSEREKVRKAYENRYRRLKSKSDYENEKMGGMRRVDFLKGRSRFLGLSRARGGEGVWVLNTG